MSDRPGILSPRKENTRNKNIPAVAPIQFGLEEIWQHFVNSIEDIGRQHTIADQLEHDGRVEEAMYIRRSQVVFVEGALDFFMHEISKYAFVKMFTGEWEKTDKYANFPLPMKTVEDGLRNPETTGWLFDQLNKRFSLEVYLSDKALGDQLNLIGMNYTDICEAAFQSKERRGTDKPGKKRMLLLYERRNQIAHQTDRRHETAEKEKIDRQFVEEAMSTVNAFVSAVYLAAKTKH